MLNFIPEFFPRSPVTCPVLCLAQEALEMNKITFITKEDVGGSIAVLGGTGIIVRTQAQRQDRKRNEELLRLVGRRKVLWMIFENR